MARLSVEGAEAAWVSLSRKWTWASLRDVRIQVLSTGVKNQKGKEPEKELSYRSSDKGKDKTEKLMKSEAEVMISSGVAQILIQGKTRRPTPSLL